MALRDKEGLMKNSKSFCVNDRAYNKTTGKWVKIIDIIPTYGRSSEASVYATEDEGEDNEFSYVFAEDLVPESVVMEKSLA